MTKLKKLCRSFVYEDLFYYSQRYLLQNSTQGDDIPACLTGISSCSDITSCRSAGTNPI